MILEAGTNPVSLARATMHMQGRRVYPNECGRMALDPGEYGQLAGIWWVCPPPGGGISASAVQADRVVENEDGTISVRGLLRLPRWTGRLEHGVWIEAEQPGGA